MCWVIETASSKGFAPYRRCVVFVPDRGDEGGFLGRRRYRKVAASVGDAFATAVA
jgi:hypothetical protein